MAGAAASRVPRAAKSAAAKHVTTHKNNGGFACTGAAWPPPARAGRPAAVIGGASDMVECRARARAVRGWTAAHSGTLAGCRTPAHMHKQRSRHGIYGGVAWAGTYPRPRRGTSAGGTTSPCRLLVNQWRAAAPRRHRLSGRARGHLWAVAQKFIPPSVQGAGPAAAPLDPPREPLDPIIPPRWIENIGRRQCDRLAADVCCARAHAH